MKLIQCLIFLSVLIGCSAKPSVETTYQDTLTVDSIGAGATEDMVVELIEPPAKPEPIIVTDSAANVLKNLVDAKFDSLYLLLTDTSIFYKVELEDYYDEYEGQDQKKTIEWYFNKSLSVVYAKYIFESGSLEQPEVTEYILDDEKILYVKNDSKLYGPDYGRSFIKWSLLSGGVKLNWSEYWKKVKSIESIPEDYLKTIQEEWDANLSLLIVTINKEEEITGDEDVYSIDIRVPKHAELVDYTSVTIPKQIYKKLRE